ncbi:LysR family transcriptional regulator substrate-binding protein [Peterkaempfera sp. SMS 1(5)a]|uniref:LysR family transcriptional regulator substrate-binding protein n=1 Tax=Peterkaempfera podocarpi TaxID=3232308 RepID=UPI003670E584
MGPLPTLVGRLHRRHPGCTFHITDAGGIDGVEEAVRSGRCELGLTAAPPGRGLRSAALSDQDLLLVPAATGYDELPDPVPLAGLARLSLVAPPANGSSRIVVEQAFADVGAAPRIVVECFHRGALIALAEAGAGSAFLPRALARAAQHGGCAVRTTVPPLRRRVQLIRRRTRSPHRPGPC